MDPGLYPGVPPLPLILELIHSKEDTGSILELIPVKRVSYDDLQLIHSE